MLKQFYEKALPDQEDGSYCIGTFDRSLPRAQAWKHHWVDSIEEIFPKIESLKQANKYDIYVAMGVFDGYKRDAPSCMYLKSFFLDLDVGEEKARTNKGYATQADALKALDKLIEEAGLPPPVRVSSGVGIHAYWVLDEKVRKDQFLPYAKLFKEMCLKHIIIDPDANSADAARCMRWADSFNYDPTPPAPTAFLDDDIYEYSFDAFKDFLGEPPPDTKLALEEARRGLDDDTRAILKLDNFERSFQQLAEKSLNGEGCPQIANILVNSRDLTEPLWWAGLSVAKFCGDGDEAIHILSEDYHAYNKEETIEKASRLDAPRTCGWFLSNYPDHCDGCKFKGKINSPISLARVFKPAPPSDPSKSVWEAEDSEKIFNFPDTLFPFSRGENGGVYYQPPPSVDSKGNKTVKPIVMLLAYDFYPIRRMFSKHDGECLVMYLKLPKDTPREVLLPMKSVYSVESLKGVLTSNGVFFTPTNTQQIMDYIVKWGQFMQATGKADMMRMQMGWTEEIQDEAWAKRSFVIGDKEVTHLGNVVDAPTSPFVRGLAKMLHPRGTYERWRESVDELRKPEFEIHSFALLCGFASPLMCYTSTPGVSVCLLGESGAAKTGALYAGLSIWGNPSQMSVCETTDNGLTGRYLALRNLPFGLDEISNKDPKPMSNTIHRISNGKTKIRLQASVNAEREHEMAASLISIFTTNQSIYQKLEIIKANPDGEAARVVEFLVRQPSLLKSDAGGLFGAKVFNAFNFNYGHAGPMFIKEVFRLGDAAVLGLIEKWGERFSKDFGGDSSYRYHKNLISVTFAAGEICNSANIVNVDLESVYKFIVLQMINIRENVVKVNRTDYGAILGDYMNKNLGNILVLSDGRAKIEPRNQIVARISVDEGLLQISKADFKKYLNDISVSSREFEFVMKNSGQLIDSKKGRLTTGWKGAISTDPTYLYWFKIEIPSEWIGNDPGSNP
jgi:hypothetical protein